MGSKDVTESPSIPSITPIQTTTKEVSSDAGEEECHTPRSDAHMIKPTLVCPPAPRKRRPMKRKAGPPPQGFVAVPRDLDSIFLPLPISPKKKIRLGKGPSLKSVSLIKVEREGFL